MGETDKNSEPRPGRRKVWVVLAVLAVIAVGAGLALPLLLDVERHRERVEDALRDVTGWEPELGEMRLSVLRGLKLSVSPASLTSPDGGSRVQIGSIRVKAAWGPLFAGRLEIERIEVVSPSIDLERRDAESGWPVPSTSATGEGVPATDPPRISTAPSTEQAASASPIAISIDVIEISGGAVRITDRAVEPATVVEIRDISSRLEPAVGTIDGSASIGSGRLEWNGELAGAIEIRLTGLASEELASMIGPGLLQPGGTLSGAVTVARPLTVDGRVDVQNFRLETGEHALDEATVTFRLVDRGETEPGLLLESLEIVAGEARIEGHGTIEPDLSIELEMPETPLGPALALARTLFPLPLNLQEPGAAALHAWLENDAEGNLTYRVEGTLDAAGLQLVDFLPEARNLRTEFKLSPEGRFDLALRDSRFGSGSLTGKLSLDSVDPPGKLRCSMKLFRTELGEVLAGFLPEGSGGIAGLADGKADITIDLSVPDPGPEALSGTLRLTTGTVTLPGWDVEKRIDDKLQKTLGGLAGLLGKKLSGGSANDGEADAIGVFDRLTFGVDLDERPWKLQPFRARTGALAIRGTGTFDPLAGDVNLHFNALFTPARSSELIERYKQLRYLADDKGRIVLPLDIDGSVTQPHIGIDIGEALLGDDGEGDKKDVLKGILKGLLDRDD